MPNKMRPVNIVLAIAALVFLLLLSIKPYEASRVLDEEVEEWLKTKSPPLPSLQNVPSPNPGTHVPIGEKSFAGRIMAPPPPAAPSRPHSYPQLVVPFGVANNHK